jgi:hypothetical protein
VVTETSLDDEKRRKILPLQDSNSVPSTIQLIASCYFDCAILALSFAVLRDFKVWFTIIGYKVFI